MELKSIDVLEKAMIMSLISSRRIPKVPGAVINFLSEDYRNILSNLKSDDILNLRKDACGYLGEKLSIESKEKLEFDKKMKHAK